MKADQQPEEGGAASEETTSILSEVLPPDKMEGLRPAVQAVVDWAAGPERPAKINAQIADAFIVAIERKIEAQVNEILHHPKFQELEAAWRGLDSLVTRTDFMAEDRVIIEVLNVDKETLKADFDAHPGDMYHTHLYKQVYDAGFNIAGGKPYGLMVGNYEFENTAEDIDMLENLGNIGRASHCPFVGSIGAKFFDFESIEKFALMRKDDLQRILDSPDYIQFRNFRQSEASRYVGLTMPRFLLRHPYGKNNKVPDFQNFSEQIDPEKEHERFLWGNTAFAFATAVSRSFTQWGWMNNVAGKNAGGKIPQLPIHTYEVAGASTYKVPTEAWITDTNEFNWSELGFIPLVSYQDEDFAVFFSSQAVRAPNLLLTDEASRANERLGASLSNIMLTCRFAHYLKCILRDNLGRNMTPSKMSSELEQWVKQYWVDQTVVDDITLAKCPLRDYKIDIKEKPDNPGFYYIDFMMTPHAKFVGAELTMSLVADVPEM
ncbi:MAG: type VI secretion system contractile sheath large subunit [bacterium]|nr:type VI secretion system contractile sheath large subunit [bacterium]